MEYSNQFGSNFPASIISIGTKKDIDSYVVDSATGTTVADLVTQYYSYIDSADIDSAKALYEANKSILESYIIDAAYINRLEEEIYNTGLLVLKQAVSVINESEPADQMTDGYWYEDYS